MSSVGSSSVGNMPPRHGKKIADAMDETFKENGKTVDETKPRSKRPENGPEALAAPRNVESAPAPVTPALPRKIQGYALPTRSRASVAFAPRGHAVALKALDASTASRYIRNVPIVLGHPVGGTQASFSAPLSSSHEAKLSSLTTLTVVHHASNSPSVVNSVGPSTEPARTKRKPAPKVKRGEVAEDKKAGADSEHEGPPSKKRRVSGEGRATVMKDFNELEGAIKTFQFSVNKELKNLAALASTLSAQLREMDN
ncbi:hypothetical protein H0H87_011580 [Tephrocybe sp. NHM501043]|nr:hypothetical protein H0H87_011580 [Tephrocybe sp. NHM501043]